MKEAAGICIEYAQRNEKTASLCSEVYLRIAFLREAKRFYGTAAILYNDININDDRAIRAWDNVTIIRAKLAELRKLKSKKDIDDMIETVPKRLKAIFPKDEDEAVDKIEESLKELKKLL